MTNLEYIALFVYVVPATLILFATCCIIRVKNQLDPLDRNGHMALQRYVKDNQGTNLYPKHTEECGIWCGCSGCSRTWR